MMDIEKEEAEQLARRDFIKASARAVSQEAAEAKEQMQKLETRYVLALAENRLGELTNGKLDEIREKMNEASSVVYRAPKILEGLKIFEHEVEERLKVLGKEVQRLRLQERYDDLKAEIEENFDKHKAMTLRQLSDDLGCYWPTVEWLEKLEAE